jgi:hypothetical protein
VDVSGVYWPAVAGATGLVAVVPFLVLGRGQPWLSIARLVGIANLIVVFVNGAAPIRGLLDPAYVGYGFGLLSAEKGLPVTLMAGPLVIMSAVAAWICARNRSGALMLLVAATCVFHTGNIGLPLIESLVRDPASVEMQFGEYFTLPAAVAIPTLVSLMVLPFLLGSAWALSRAFEAE